MTGVGELNMKFPFVLHISVFMSCLNFIRSSVELGKSFNYIRAWFPNVFRRI